ncbi:hypothetical protein ACN6UZ_002485 [Cronobacter dublinensis]
MSNYVSTGMRTQAFTGTSSERPLFMNVHSSTTSQKTDTKIIGGVFSGIVVAALLTLANLGTATNTNTTNINSVKQTFNPVTNRSKGDDRDYDESKSETESLVSEIEYLQKFLGFKTMQWAKILKVERKTIYNWRSDPATKIQNKTKDRVSVLNEFAKEFNPNHAAYFNKFLFGKNANKDLLSAFLKEPLDIKELLEQYDEIYTAIDGFYKRNKMLGS